MGTVKYIFGIFLFLCIAVTSNAQDQDAHATLKKVNDFYSNKSLYQINMSFKMYQGLTGNQLTESYDGIVVRNKAVTGLRMANSEMLQVGEKQVAVDHDQKLMIVRKAPETSVTNAVMNIDAFMESYDVASITNLEDTIRCELIAKKNKVSVPYAKIVLFMNKDTYEIERQEMIFANQLPFKNENGDVKADFGRLLIEMKLKDRIDDTINLSFDQYFTENENHQRVMKERFEEYQLIDETK